jgi:hypothetical protein
LRLLGGFQPDLLVLLAVDLVLGFLRGPLVLQLKAELFEFGGFLLLGEWLDLFCGLGEVLVAAGGR